MSTSTSDFLRHLRTLTARQAIGSLSDQQLLERFRLERSEASFAVLVQRHGPMVLSVCRRVLHNVQDVEDAFQATFLVLAKKAARLRQPPLLGGWLHGVAYHVALRLKAKTQRRAVHEQRAGSPSRETRDDITWRELRAVLDEELQRLKENHRAPLVLCYLEGRTQDEAARLLGWSKSTFRRRLESGRKRLGSQLARRGITLSAALTAPLLIDGAATASVPPLLAATTVRAGLASALGNTVSGMVSDQVVALAEGGAGSLLAKKASIAFVLLVSLTLGIGGLLAHRAANSPTFAEAPAAPPAPAEQSPPARNANKDQTIEITGRVFGSDGKVLPGAHVYKVLPRAHAYFSWTEAIKEKVDLTVKTTTGADGRFRLAVSKADLAAGAKILAKAKGQGPDWIELPRAGQPGEVTLRLVVDDVPITGRIIDLEGRPIAGVSVSVGWMEKGDIKQLLEPRRRGSTPAMSQIGPAALDGPVSVKTGKDGRFRLSGFGRDRIALLMVRGEDIEGNDLPVLTHAGPVSGKYLNSLTLLPAAFTHAVAPTKPFVGTVRDKRTGKPLAGIRVVGQGWYGASFSLFTTTTDEEGRYRIVGLGKQERYQVGAGGAPYFRSSRYVDGDTPGLEPVTVDFELERGVTVTGRVTDKATGLPVHGRVNYIGLTDNANLKDLTDFRAVGFLPEIWEGKIATDGTFSVVCAPGPGLLCVRAEEDNKYVRSRLEGYRIASQDVLAYNHAIVRIDPSEQDAKSRTCAITLEQGRSLAGTLIGPDGQPIAGASVEGLRSVVLDYPIPETEKLETAAFTISGLSPKQTRNLLFVHPEKKLAKVQTIRGDEKAPLTVRLEAMGILSGRIVDAKGLPRAGLKVSATYRDQELEASFLEGKEPKNLPWELLTHSRAWSKILNREATTDKDGKFRLEGLAPGIEYDLAVLDGQTTVFNQEHLSVSSGKVNDLGDLKTKLTSEREATEKP